MKWIDEGENPTRYFSELESRNFISKQVPRIEKDDGTLVTKQEEILNEPKLFYKMTTSRERDLRQKKMTTHQDVPKLSQDESQSLEGTLSEQETLMFL